MSAGDHRWGLDDIRRAHAPAPDDASWAEAARSSREALALLGWPIGDKCLPDESGPCGASFALHAAAHFGTITAVVEHQVRIHLGPDLYPAFDEIRAHTETELDAACGQHDVADLS